MEVSGFRTKVSSFFSAYSPLLEQGFPLPKKFCNLKLTYLPWVQNDDKVSILQTHKLELHFLTM